MLSQVWSLQHFARRALRETLETAPLVGLVIKPSPPRDDAVHLDAAMAWLRRTVAETGDRGCAHSYMVLKGWRPAYPETTGYILKTFLRLADREDRAGNEAIARGLADWLLGLQRSDGGIAGLDLARATGPVVFNTGMVLLGWNAMHARTGEAKYLEAGRRAGDFMITCLDDEGCFVRHTSHGIVHTYNSRAAWALIELGKLGGDERFVQAGIRNMDWTLRQENEHAFFRNNIFRPGGNSITHGIGYVLSALIEAYFLTGDDAYLAAVRRSAEKLVHLYGMRGRLVAELDERWGELSRHVCLTGYAQLAIVLMQLWTVEPDPRYLNLACQLIDDVKPTQDLGDPASPAYGAIAGSYPVYGRYARLQYPNWATKFFADALLMKMKVMPAYANSVLDELPAGRQQAVEAKPHRAAAPAS